MPCAAKRPQPLVGGNERSDGCLPIVLKPDGLPVSFKGISYSISPNYIHMILNGDCPSCGCMLNRKDCTASRDLFTTSSGGGIQRRITKEKGIHTPKFSSRTPLTPHRWQPGSLILSFSALWSGSSKVATTVSSKCGEAASGFPG